MSDVLDRIISRTQAPLSLVQPILPSVFAPVSPAAEIESEVVISNVTAQRGTRGGAADDIRTHSADHDQPPSNGREQAQGRGAEDRSPKPLVELPAPPEMISRNTVTLANLGQQHASLARGEVADTSPPQHASTTRIEVADISPPQPAQPAVQGPHTDSGSKISSPAKVLSPEVKVRPEPATPLIHSAQERSSTGIFGEVAQPAAMRPSKTEVFISIGHIEVRSAPRIEPARAPKQRHKVTLQNYLNRPNGEAL